MNSKRSFFFKLGMLIVTAEFKPDSYEGKKRLTTKGLWDTVGKGYITYIYIYLHAFFFLYIPNFGIARKLKFEVSNG